MPTIEQNIERIANYLEKIAENKDILTASINTNTSTNTNKTTENVNSNSRNTFEEKTTNGDHDAATNITKDDVRKALQIYREIEGTPAMLEILKRFGATTLNDLDESKYNEVITAVS